MIPPSYDVVALGLNAVDILIRLPEKVIPDTKHMARELIIQGGAPVGTGSSAMAMLGYTTAFVGRLGRNTLSEIAIDQFKKYGVSVDLIVRDESSRPALALVEIDPNTAARTVFVNLDDYGFVRQEDIPVDALRSARVLMVDSYDLNATELALEAVRGSGCRTMLDFESGDTERMRRLLALGTEVILPLECGRQLSGKESPENVLGELAKITSGQLVVTDGANGSWGLKDGSIIHQPAMAASGKIDSTGCGDAFHAGYVAGLLEGWPLEERMEFGASLASLVIGHVGGRTALPRRNQLADILSDEMSSSLRELLKLFSRKI